MLRTTLGRVLEFFGTQGATLSYVPSMVHVEAHYHREMELVARIGLEVPASRGDQASLSRLWARNRCAALWREMFGLAVSREAIEELNDLVHARRVARESGPQRDEQGDILLFPTFRWSSLQTWFLAHEVWHLIEAERELLEGAEPIREGTATFAASLFAGTMDNPRFIRAPEQCHDMMALRRAGVAFLARERLDGSAQPLVELLRKPFRSALQQAVLERCTPHILALAERAAKDPVYTNDFSQYLRRTLRHAALAGEVSPDAIVAAYRRLGAARLAGELESQDLSRFVSLLRESG